MTEALPPAAQDLTDETLAERRAQRLRQAMDDTSMLVAFMAEGKRPGDAAMLAKLIAAQAVYAEKKRLTDVEEAEFWGAYNAVAQAALPATIEGIKCGAANKTLGFFGWMLKYPWISVPAIIALFGYLVLQIHTVQGADILKQYQTTLEQIAQTRAQQKLAAAGEGGTPADPSQAQNRLELLAGQLVRYQGMLAEWNRCPIYSMLFTCKGAVSRGAEEAVRAQITLNNLNASILPTILGLLGACTQVLRAIARRVIDQSMNPIFLPAYYVRIVLGLIIGATIGLFLLSLS